MKSFLTRIFITLAAVAIFSTGAALVAPQDSHAKVKFKCSKFKPGELNVILTDGSFKVAERNNWILDFGRNRAEARLAVHVMQHYGMTRKCELNPPDVAVTHFLVGGELARGAIVGEDCIGFSPKRVEYKRIGKQYFLVHGSTRLLPVGTKEEVAKRARRMIRNKKAKNICFIGRPDPSMIYFRK